MARICPSCGRTSETLIEGMCPECFASRRSLIQYQSNRIEVEACKMCGSIRLGNKWVKAGSFAQAVKSSIEYHLGKAKPAPPLSSAHIAGITFETIPDWRTIARIQVEARYGHTIIRGTRRIEVLLRPVVCPVCKNRLGGDYDTALRIITEEPRRVEEQILAEASRSGLLDSMVDIVSSKKEVIVFLTHRGAASRIIKSLSRKWNMERLGSSTEDVGIGSTGRFRVRKIITIKLKPGRRE